MFLFIGLGNPGEKYEKTRHNIGRETLMAWQKKSDLADFEFNKKYNALVLKEKKAVLLLPETFMNNSGKAVGPAVKFFKTKPENTIVVHDDADIELGRMKLSFNRSAAGHKGVESVKRSLKTEKFWRLRIGIQKKKRIDAMKLVLMKFAPAEETALKKVIKKARNGIDMILNDGPSQAMNFINQN